MKGDFSRDSFAADKHFLRVLMQQGRVQLDSDWNEQVSILLHYMQTLARDLIGPHGGPSDTEQMGFRISIVDGSLHISPGRYYVDGMLCENAVERAYEEQPDYVGAPDLPAEPYLVYLDVWERHINADEDASIREIALGGVDTATRSKVIAQVKALPVGALPADAWAAAQFLSENLAPPTCMLKTQLAPAADLDDPCIIDPESKFRGAENQLYRVEIHRSPNDDAPAATFKWSRDNGAIVFPIVSLQGVTAHLAHLGRDSRTTLEPGHIVEIVDEARNLRRQPGELLEVAAVDRETSMVTFTQEAVGSQEAVGPDTKPSLRRWDHRPSPDDEGAMNHEGAVEVVEGAWIKLEDGLEIWFEPFSDDAPATYRSGDYWLIPARTGDGLLAPALQSPHGIQHHFAPLAGVDAGNVSQTYQMQISAMAAFADIVPPPPPTAQPRRRRRRG